MTMTLLTDTQQKKLLSELYGNTTQTKIEAVLRKFNLDKIPAEIKAEVAELRKEQKARHKIDFWKFVRNTANDVAKNIDKFS
jgi:hypothetical protein